MVAPVRALKHPFTPSPVVEYSPDGEAPIMVLVAFVLISILKSPLGLNQLVWPAPTTNGEEVLQKAGLSSEQATTDTYWAKWPAFNGAALFSV